VVTLVCLGFRKAGILKDVINQEHYHDLGKWMFAMTAFYTYIAFSQYMLIWYANLPEKPSSTRPRPGTGSCQPGAAYCPLLHPFFILLCRRQSVI